MLTLSGCTHLSALDGAVPVGLGNHEFTVDLSAVRNPNLVQTPVAVPLPSFGFHYRRGVANNVDIGLHVHPLGLGADVRYRFAEVNGWSFATQPGVGGLILPIPGFQYGQLDVSIPVRAEHALGKGWGVAFGPGVLYRQTFFGAQTEAFNSTAGGFELYAGGGARIFHSWPKLRLGLSGTLYGDALRASGVYGGVGFDLGLINRGKGGKEALGGRL